jgi:hypothetical protein
MTLCYETAKVASYNLCLTCPEGHLPKDGIKVITPRFQAKMSSSWCKDI